MEQLRTIRKAKSLHHPMRREQSTVNALRLRVAAIESGRSITVPEYKSMIGIVNSITTLRTTFGQFESDKSAVAFALAGVVLHEPIALETILTLKQSRAGFLPDGLNESQIRHLLSTRKVELGHRYSADTVLLWDDISIEEEEPFVIDEITVVPGENNWGIAEERRFR